MLSKVDLHVIGKSIRNAQPSEQTLKHLERVGNEAFDFIRDALRDGSLPDNQKVNALLRLALLTRLQCQERKEDVLDFALLLMTDPSVRVRSAATVSAISLVSLLEQEPAATFRNKYPIGA